jgi:cytidylate kinase
MNDTRGEEEKYTSLEEARRLLAERAATECVRYKEIYNLNYMDFSNYDLVIDSTFNTPDRIAEVVLKEAREHEISPNKAQKQLVSPKRLLFDDEHKGMEKDQLQSLIEEYKKVSYAIDTVIKVKKIEDDYLVINNFDQAKAAIYAEVSYVPIEVVKS